jgi:hypothetical protein
MTRTQKDFLAAMTTAQATALMAKFGNDPEIAYAKSHETFCAFSLAWELVHPDEYIQISSLAGGTEFTVQYMA